MRKCRQSIQQKVSPETHYDPTHLWRRLPVPRRPTPKQIFDLINWQPALAGDLRYLSINNTFNSTMFSNYRQTECSFWSHYLPTVVGHLVPTYRPSTEVSKTNTSDPEPASVPRDGDTAAKLGQWKYFQNLQDRWEARRSNPKYLILWIIVFFLQEFPAYLTISTIIWCAFSKVRIKPA